mmetsp:Transcript_3244/g.12424  ORF Transcript_3244/g.12424 Transcript_3244/m.12424 type:complete len:537 (-) Transcript_3244:506-2116(-)
MISTHTHTQSVTMITLSSELEVLDDVLRGGRGDEGQRRRCRTPTESSTGRGGSGGVAAPPLRRHRRRSSSLGGSMLEGAAKVRDGGGEHETRVGGGARVAVGEAAGERERGDDVVVPGGRRLLRECAPDARASRRTRRAAQHSVEPLGRERVEDGHRLVEPQPAVLDEILRDDEREPADLGRRDDGGVVTAVRAEYRLGDDPRRIIVLAIIICGGATGRRPAGERLQQRRVVVGEAPRRRRRRRRPPRLAVCLGGLLLCVAWHCAREPLHYDGTVLHRLGELDAPRNYYAGVAPPPPLWSQGGLRGSGLLPQQARERPGAHQGRRGAVLARGVGLVVIGTESHDADVVARAALLDDDRDAPRRARQASYGATRCGGGREQLVAETRVAQRHRPTFREARHVGRPRSREHERRRRRLEQVHHDARLAGLRVDRRPSPPAHDVDATSSGIRRNEVRRLESEGQRDHGRCRHGTWRRSPQAPRHGRRRAGGERDDLNVQRRVLSVVVSIIIIVIIIISGAAAGEGGPSMSSTTAPPPPA